MEKNIYLVCFTPDTQTLHYLGTTFTNEQAFAIVRDFLSNNPNVKSEQVFVKKYSYEKDLKILDYQE